MLMFPLLLRFLWFDQQRRGGRNRTVPGDWQASSAIDKDRDAELAARPLKLCVWAFCLMPRTRRGGQKYQPRKFIREFYQPVSASQLPFSVERVDAQERPTVFLPCKLIPITWDTASPSASHITAITVSYSSKPLIAVINWRMYQLVGKAAALHGTRLFRRREPFSTQTVFIETEVEAWSWVWRESPFN